MFHNQLTFVIMTTGLVLLKYLCYSSKIFSFIVSETYINLEALWTLSHNTCLMRLTFYCLRNLLWHILYYQKKNFANLHLQLLVCGSAQNISRHFVENLGVYFVGLLSKKDRHLKCKVLLYHQPTSLSSDLESLCIIRDCITICNANTSPRLSGGQIYCHFQWVYFAVSVIWSLSEWN